MVNNGFHPIDLKRGIEYAGKISLKYLENTKGRIKKRSEIYDLAMIVTNKDELISEIITDALIKTGTNGYLNIEESPTGITDLMVFWVNLKIFSLKFSYKISFFYLKILEGISLTNGIPTKEFLNKNEDSLEFKDCLIITCLEKINNFEYIVKILEFVKNTNRSLIIFSPSIKKEVESMLLFNKRKNGLNVKKKKKNLI